MPILKIILSIFLPPVAAYMQVGVSTHFWINIVATLCLGVPGIIHALWLVLTDKKA
ncbi:MAG: YqaE/Pmp3 family membrane protein [Candidatus Aceula meridiana]|nr:YqaE/Pmp3 family membrane protein [Candidatus Aceula meridiana]